MKLEAFEPTNDLERLVVDGKAGRQSLDSVMTGFVNAIVFVSSRTEVREDS